MEEEELVLLCHVPGQECFNIKTGRDVNHIAVSLNVVGMGVGWGV